MLLRRFLAATVALAFILSIFSVSSFAGNDEKADKAGKVSWTWADEQGPAKVGTPVKWTRTVAIANDGEREKKIHIKKFPRNTDLIENNPLLNYKKKEVEYVAPVGTSTVVIDYETPAPTSKITVTANNATHYLFDFVIDADTDVHYTDVDMPVDVPGLTWDWNYFFNWKQPDGSFSQQRLYAASTDGDRKTYEKIGWKAPHLSTQQGGGGGQKSPSKIRNYDFETARGNNNTLPELWFAKGILGTELADDLIWKYLPVSKPGYGSATSLQVKHSDVESGRIYAEPINGTGGTFNLEFAFKPSFSGEACTFCGGAEVLFGDSTGDTTYPFCFITDDPATWYAGEDYDVNVTDLNGGWKNVSLSGKNSVDSQQYIRFYFSTEDCGNNVGNSYLIDDVLIS